MSDPSSDPAIVISSSPPPRPCGSPADMCRAMILWFSQSGADEYEYQLTV